MKNLFDYWEDLRQTRMAGQVIVFLDYDGTLAPIAPLPSQACLPDKNRDLISELVKIPSYKVAIISGRSLDDIKRAVDVEGVVYVGNHGWEIEGASMHFKSLVPLQVSSVMQKIKYELITQLSDIHGAFVEDKGITLSVHYRLVAADKEPLVKRIFDYICMPYRSQNLVKVDAGKKVLELRPPLEWDKGKAILWLLRKQEVLHGMGGVWPVYFGDDSTDEDAFQELKNKGTTVLVGMPRRFSAAQYFLPGLEDVTEILKRMVNGAYQKES